MRREKSPGLKILWVWTLGTAAVLVTSVVRTRLRDMENLMKTEEQQQQQQPSITTDTETLSVDTLPQSTDVIQEEKS